MRVREGQGVVLLCGPPPHSGGKSDTSLFFCYLLVYVSSQSVICGAHQQIFSVSEESLSVLHRSVEIVLNGCSDSSSALCLSGQSESCVCAVSFQIFWLFVCVCKVSGVSHFYFGTLWSISLIFSRDEEKLWHADWRCLWLGPCQGE